MDTRLFWTPNAGWCHVDNDMPRQEPKPVELINHFPPLQHTKDRLWQDVGTSRSEPASSYMPWYASPTESDGPRTSDLSPVSGYFDWSHSSNNTSPVQPDDVVLAPRADSILHQNELRRYDEPPFLVPDNPDISYAPYRQSVSTLSSQFRHSVATGYPASERPAVPLAQDGTDFVLSHLSSQPKCEDISDSNAMDVPEHDDLGNPRAGKHWKAAHRAVERRYRSNLNLKIVKLGQCIPAIRNPIAVENAENGDDCGTTLKTKLQKGQVLSKAVEYIQSLQEQVSELESQKRRLERRVETLNMMVQDDVRPPQLLQGPRVLSETQKIDYQQATDGFSSALCHQRPQESSSFGAQSRPSPARNGYSFVSEDPSIPMKRPKPNSGGNPL